MTSLIHQLDTKFYRIVLSSYFDLNKISGENVVYRREKKLNTTIIIKPIHFSLHIDSIKLTIYFYVIPKLYYINWVYS